MKENILMVIQVTITILGHNILNLIFIDKFDHYWKDHD